ncbi:hypothetical protein BC941DRAFT_519373 [Chlamydoabsidia padenii]|nr:hypothetical protein BC941DRAFT_519373 [Chlamydoabsidia padenii]
MASHLPLPNAIYRYDNYLPFIVTAYITLSLSAVFVNKYLTTASEYKFNYSTITVLLQLIIALIITQLWKRTQSRLNLRPRLPALESGGWKKVWPCTSVYCTLVLLDPHFITRVSVIKYISIHATGLIFTLVLGLVWKKRPANTTRTSKSVWATCLLQCASTWLISSGLSPWLIYPFIVSIYGHVIQRTLVAFRNNLGQLLQWHLIMAFLVILVLTVLSGELVTVYRSVLFLDELGFWIQMAIGSILAMATHVLMVMVIKSSSPLTFMVASTSKTCLQAILALLVFRNSMSGYQFSCLSISLLGAALYSMSSTTKPVNSVYSM